eukprot:TRINITY_DN7054_c0_g3_i1.p1 TRINITY_DN7054_c0_g3~~TRINITY_DN7054_c0_g3_i1.p1  ORF type:complete len:1024 (+),score=197.34 TRINITY_DN7054_c0_g3_i1:107-3178(+)
MVWDLASYGCFPRDSQSSDDVFLRQFSDHREGEADAEWAESYADARGLLLACRNVRAGEASQPILFALKWKENFTQPCSKFTNQLQLLRKHWTSLQATLKKIDNQPDYDEYKGATADIVMRVVEDHYRGLLQLQVYQYWHRSLFERCLATLGEHSNFLSKNRWWCDKDAMEFRSAGTLTCEMRAVVARFAEFRTNLQCDKAGVPRGSASYRVKQEEAEASLSRRRIAKEGTPREYWQFGFFFGAAVTLSSLLICAFASSPTATYNADRDLWEAFPYFRGFFVFYMALLLWGFVLGDMERSRVNYPYLLGLRGEAIRSLHVLKIACMLLAFWSIALTLYILHVRNGVSVLPHGLSPKWYVVANFFMPLGLFFWPFQSFSLVPHGTRWWLVTSLLSVAVTPFIPVTFACNFVTDYLTSMVKVLLDVSMTACVVFSGDLWNEYRVICVPRATSDLSPTGADRYTSFFNNAAVFCTLTPLLWRFLQCSRKAVIEPIIIPTVRATDVTDDDMEASVSSKKGDTSGTRHILGRFQVAQSATVLKVEEETDELLPQAGVTSSDEPVHLKRRLVLTYHEETARLHAFPALTLPGQSPSSREQASPHSPTETQYVRAAKAKLDAPLGRIPLGIAPGGTRPRTNAWHRVRARVLEDVASSDGGGAARQLEADLNRLETESDQEPGFYYMCYLQTPASPGILTVVPTRKGDGGIEQVVLLFEPTDQLGTDPIHGDNPQKHVDDCVLTARQRSVSQPVNRKRREYPAAPATQAVPTLPLRERFREASRQEASMLFPHFYNMMKYCCSILPVTVGIVQGQAAGWSFARVAYILLLCLSTCYSFCWDIFVDWGLWRREGFPRQGLHPLGIGGWVWRRTSIDFSTGHGLMWYAVLILFNLMGRCAWAITLVVNFDALGISGAASSELLTLVTATLEVARRSVWARIRLGHEQTVDVGHYRAGDGYSEVPPLLSRNTPWTVPGEYSVLRTFRLDTLEDEVQDLRPVEGAVTTTLCAKAPARVSQERSGWFTAQRSFSEP